MLHFLVDDFLVAVQAEVVSLRNDVGFGNAEALIGPGAVEFTAIAVRPPCQRVGQVVLGVFVGGERVHRHGAELVLGQEWGSLVVKRPAIGFHVVEPHVIGAARVCLREEKDRCGYPGVGAEHATRERHDAIELLVLDENLPQRLVGVA